MIDLRSCPPAWAKDVLLIPAGLEGQAVQTATCSFLLPFYFTSLAIVSMLSFAIALARTRLLLEHRKRHQHSSKRRSFISYISPYFTIAASWGSFFTVVLFIILPLALDDLNGAIIVVFGFQCLCLNVLAERFFRKMVRLGSKLITSRGGPSRSSRDNDSSNIIENSQIVSGIRLSHSDWVLRLCEISILTITTFQVLSLCFLSWIFPTEIIWLRLGIGGEGLAVSSALFGMLWQYHRCGLVIRRSQRDLANMNLNPSPLDQVLTRFRAQQIVEAFVGSLTIIISVLLGVGVIPISYIIIPAYGLLDVAVNGGILLTFIMKPRKRRGQAAGIVSGDARLTLGATALTEIASLPNNPHRSENSKQDFSTVM